MELKNVLTIDLLEELELRLIEIEIKKGAIFEDSTQGCPRFIGIHSMNFSDFKTLQNCQIACPKYLVCRKKILEKKLKRS